MLTKEQAAKYLIVAWSKDWTTQTYLSAVYEGARSQIDSIAADCPWMPSHIHWYSGNRGRGLPIRQLVADCYPSLSNALWDAADDKARLALWTRVVGLIAGNVTTKSRISREDRLEARRIRRATHASKLGLLGAAKQREKSARRAWNVVK